MNKLLDIIKNGLVLGIHGVLFLIPMILVVCMNIDVFALIAGSVFFPYGTFVAICMMCFGSAALANYLVQDGGIGLDFKALLMLVMSCCIPLVAHFMGAMMALIPLICLVILIGLMISEYWTKDHLPGILYIPLAGGSLGMLGILLLLLL